MKRRDRLAERRIRRVEHMVHLGRQPRRHVPIVSLGQHMVAALEANAAIAQRIIRLDVESGPHFGARRFDYIAHPLSDYARWIGQPVIGAPALDGERRAVMGEEIGVQRFEERQRFEPAAKSARPRLGFVGERSATLSRKSTAIAARPRNDALLICLPPRRTVRTTLPPLRSERAQARRVCPPIPRP